MSFFFLFIIYSNRKNNFINIYIYKMLYVLFNFYKSFFFLFFSFIFFFFSFLSFFSSFFFILFFPSFSPFSFHLLAVTICKWSSRGFCLLRWQLLTVRCRLQPTPTYMATAWQWWQITVTLWQQITDERPVNPTTSPRGSSRRQLPSSGDWSWALCPSLYSVTELP